ncbi:hypothetical protein DAPPUDRAFT_266058 [Daphnia pulex]|uniref:L-glutamate gamma-semialdehyde dehydrogenase n=1 Tax=Daphnia pulex TaxID=6669 RepID=E9HUF1_DAPPU|nr:hypothetical protein DAPPUDRAFT_266058 [Daphnia pulex]|eukprot:EFX64629.1 hypothetical protein DAPPUDRAFT_266058 [Daphnia pulex]
MGGVDTANQLRSYYERDLQMPFLEFKRNVTMGLLSHALNENKNKAGRAGRMMPTIHPSAEPGAKRQAEYTCQVVKESGPFVKFQLEWHLPQHSTNRMHDILSKPGAINTLHLKIPKLQESDSGKYRSEVYYYHQSYLKSSEERVALENALQHIGNLLLKKFQLFCSNLIAKNIGLMMFIYQTMPSNHQTKIAKFCYATPELLQKAIGVSLKARSAWEKVPLNKKVDIFFKAGDLVSTKYRSQLNASTMLGQGKTVFLAEIDAACELADFLRFDIEGWKDLSPLFLTAIGGNLAYAPAIMGNVVLWKPSDTALLSNYIVFRLMEESGIPPGVVSFLPAEGPSFGRAITNSTHLSTINFTGSVLTVHWLWKQVGENVDRFRNLPRLVGECGGKNYHLVHSSANVEHVVNSTLRGAFEYSGQKCSATSRLYVPSSSWKQVRVKVY